MPPRRGPVSVTVSEARQIVSDWARMLWDLRKRGIDLQQVENAVGIPRATLFAYREHGTQPRHQDGELLIAFWCNVMGSTRNDVPRTQLIRRPRD